MNTHLSSEQFDGVLNGEPSVDAAVHLSGCVQCAGELASLRQVFGNMREATSAAAEHHRRFVSTSGTRRMPRMAWGLAAAALFVSITAPVAVHYRAGTHVVKGSDGAVVAETISDEALLSSVQDDLSSSVPESLLPLASTSTNATDSSTVKRKN